MNIKKYRNSDYTINEKIPGLIYKRSSISNK